MGGEEAATAPRKRRAESTPPDGYVCRLCSVPGHWIQVCPTKKTGDKKRRRRSDHVPVPGKDPSEDDIERARELQRIPPPKCFCGLPSRLNKVKRSKDGGDSSRAIGKYFFFCAKKRSDDTQCRFARPVDLELKKRRSIDERARNKAEGDRAKDRLEGTKRGGRDAKKAENARSKQICKFYAKSGKCKKGARCGFSHDLQAEKAPVRAKAAERKTKNEGAKVEEKPADRGSDESSTSDSGSSDGSSSSDDSSSEEHGGIRNKEKDDSSGSDASSDSDSSSSEDEE